MQVPKGLENLQDETGRLHDLLWLYRYAVKAGIIKGDQGLFEVSFLMWEGKGGIDAKLVDINKKVTLKGKRPMGCLVVSAPVDL